MKLRKIHLIHIKFTPKNLQPKNIYTAYKNLHRSNKPYYFN